MSYVDAFFNRDSDTIHVVERNTKGNRVFVDYPVKHTFYYADPKGKQRSIYDTPVSRVVCKNTKEFRKELRVHDNKQLFESDLNPIYVCLSENYLNAEPPKLNVAYWDIEVNFDPERGYAAPDDAFMPITSIAVYLQWLETMVCLAIPPKTLSMEEATELVKEFPNTILFESEAELLDTFLDLIQDADVISGWNCVPLTQSVWKNDRISTMANIAYKDNLYNSYVHHVFPVSVKPVHNITMSNKHVVSSSAEHVFPVYYTTKNTYTDPSSPRLIEDELKVSDIAELIKTHDVYLRQELRSNINPDMTYRKLIIDNLDLLIKLGVDIVIKDSEIIKKMTIVKGGCTHTLLKREFWNIESIDTHLSRVEVINFINRSSTLQVYATSMVQGAVDLVLDDIISIDDLWLAGMWYTDGTNSYKTEVTICNKDYKIAEEVNKCMNKYRREIRDFSTVSRSRHDSCYYIGAGLSKIWFLKIFIYDHVKSNSNKCLNTEILSQLSTEQFLGFFAGCIDGDGSITDRGCITLHNFNNNILNFAELLHWNGIFSIVNSKKTAVNCYINSTYFASRIKHTVKSTNLNNNNTYNRTAKSEKLRWCIFDDYALVQINSIEVGDSVEMVDIETNTHYFVTAGVKTHNCQSFDVPYTVHRVAKVLSKNDTRRFCLFDQLPIKREYEKYGKTSITYDFIGRVNLDSLELYRKYTYEERHSYSLDSIAEYELGERKTEYEGTLDQLYNNDFKTFIEYNRQDTMLLEKLDKSLKFLDIANVLAHECTVLLPTTMGAVAVTEQSIINEAHRRGYVVQNRKKKDPEAVTDDEGAAGAYVAYPKKGIHDWVGSLDINSLYPSVIRALNMGPETIVGQIRQDMTNAYLRKEKALGKTITAAWESKFGSLEYDAVMEKDTGTILTIDWEDGSEDTVNAETVYRLLFESKQPWMLSANGTIFTHEREGIIPGLLKRWYAERKEMQKKAKEAKAKGDSVQHEYWDKRQHVKKIVLNSLYGAILNAGCRFYDKRIGQSVTLTGKSIARHMGAKVNEVINGDYSHLGKSIIYQDTDSEVASTVHQTNYGELTIEEMFDNCSEYWDDGDKEYACDPDLMVMSYDQTRDEPYLGHINYIYRHKVTKDLYEIVDELGNSITVTEDHSVMVERNGGLIEVKPTEILENDVLISIMINNV